MEFKFPDVGEGITEGEIVKWHVQDGDSVRIDQILVDVETAKAVVEIPSPYAGTVVAIHGTVGDVVRVGDVLVTFSESGSSKVKSPSIRQESKSVVGELEEAKDSSVRATPRARQLAVTLGVNLSSVTPSGSEGVIVEEDVRAVVPKQGKKDIAHVQRKYDFFGYVERESLSGMRKAISSQAYVSWQVPQVTHMDKVDITSLVALREKEKRKVEHLTYLPFIVLACCKALSGFRSLNASFSDGEIIYKKYYNIGVLMQTDEGLFVPIVKGAGNKSVHALAVEIHTLFEKVSSRSLDVMDMKGGTFTVTNIGNVGGEYFTPLLYDGQSSILGVGRIKQESVVLDGHVVVRWMLPLSLSYDHRVVDGVAAASFVEALKKYLADPHSLI